MLLSALYAYADVDVSFPSENPQIFLDEVFR